MNKLYLFFILGGFQMALSQTGNIGINTDNPTHKLDVNGNARVRALTSTSQYNNHENIVVVDSTGVLKTAPQWDIAPVPDKVGTVISDGTKLIVAQEITSLLTADCNITSNYPTLINTVNKKIIDNENSLNNGNFTITDNGVYQVTINAQVSYNRESNVTIGLWNNTSNQWIAITTDRYTAPTNGGLQTYTLITTVELLKNNSYSFRASTGYGGGGELATIKALSSGSTGSGDVSFFSVKRIK